MRSRVFAAAPADAIQLLSTLAESPENAKLIVEFLEHLASIGDWESIKAAVSNIPEGAGIRGGLKHASRIWAGVDPKGLIAWSDTLNSQTLRQHVGLGISNYLLNQPPEQIAALTRAFLEYTEDETLSRRLYGIALNQMLQTDSPVQAAEWALQIRDNESSDAMLFDKISDDTAKRFLQALYDRGSTERADIALTSYVEASTHRNPENTANWALEIQDVHSKARALQQAVMSWGVRDKPKARRWVESNARKLDATALLRLVDGLPTKP